MLLLSQQELSNYKITSFERAIVFSTLLLASGDLIDNYSNNISITEASSNSTLPVKSVLLIKIKLPYKKEESFRSFGGFVKNINEINLNLPQPLLVNTADIPPWNYSEYPLPAIPVWIDTCEEYLYWLVTTYQSEMIANEENNFNLIAIKNDFKSSIDIEINIPFVYESQLLLQNYLASIYPIYLWGKTNSDNGGDNGNQSIVNNEFIINNNTIIGN